MLDSYCAPYKLLGDVMISKWPNHLQTGTIFITEDSATVYALTAAFATMLFWSIFLGLEPLLERLGIKWFKNQTSEYKIQIIRDCVHMSHHIGLTIIVFQVFIY